MAQTRFCSTGRDVPDGPASKRYRLGRGVRGHGVECGRALYSELGRKLYETLSGSGAPFCDHTCLLRDGTSWPGWDAAGRGEEIGKSGFGAA